VSDHANIVREALEDLAQLDHYERAEALAALDALVTERDEARRVVVQRDLELTATNCTLRYSREDLAAMQERAEAAEAKRDEANARWNRSEIHSAGMQTRLVNAAARAEAAESQRDEAVGLLRGVVEADKQDAKMGHPNPGDSCIAIYIGLVLMEWLDKQAP